MSFYYQTHGIEGIWATLRNFLRPFRDVHKKFLAGYITIYEFIHHESEMEVSKGRWHSTISVDIRVLAATHQGLADAVEKDDFTWTCTIDLRRYPLGFPH